MHSTASVTSSTFGRLNVGYQSFEMGGRLHPCGKSGVSLARTAGSSTTAMLWRTNSSAPWFAAGSEKVREPSTRSHTLRRSSRIASGSVRKRSSSSEVYGTSTFGRTQFGVRWNTCSCSTRRAIWGTNWMALAAVPITATRSPVRSWSWSQRAEWNTVPVNSSKPGMSGSSGLPNIPTAPTTTSTSWRSPRSVVSDHTARSSSQLADATPSPSRRCGVSPYLAAQCSK